MWPTISEENHRPCGKFKDAGQVSLSNTDAMKLTVATVMIVGKSNTTLDPKGATTRAEMCAMMTRFIEHLIVPQTAD